MSSKFFLQNSDDLVTLTNGDTYTDAELQTKLAMYNKMVNLMERRNGGE